MKIVYAYGGLSNQVFCIANLLNDFDEITICIGFDDLEKYFNTSKFRSRKFFFLKKSIWSVMLFRFFKYILPFLNISIPHSYDLSPENLTKFKDYFEYKTTFYTAAKKELLKHSSADSSNFFVHVRRSDFANWPSVEANALLPKYWYISALRKLITSTDTAKFKLFIFSDDLPFCRKCFAEYKDAVFLNSDFDQVLMSLCDGGVLSPSTYSLVAILLKEHDNKDKKFIAPLYWAGFKKNMWIPKKIASQYLEFMPVEKH